MPDRTTTSLQVAETAETRYRLMWGCGFGCLLVAVLMVALVVIGVRMVWTAADGWVEYFQRQGFTLTKIADDHPVLDANARCLFTGQSIILNDNINADVAIVAQRGEIHGRIEGDLYFRGAVLLIAPSAVITGNIDAVAHEVRVDGFFQGQALGTIENQIDHRRPWAQRPQEPQQDENLLDIPAITNLPNSARSPAIDMMQRSLQTQQFLQSQQTKPK